MLQSFCSSIWSSGNKRQVYTRTIHFSVDTSLLHTDVGRIFDTWSKLEYTGYKSISRETDWCSLIRQKVNNLYTRYFDKEVILQRDYLELLHTPKKLYYQWVNGRELNAEELTGRIQDAMEQAAQLKIICQRRKMELSWKEYKEITEGYFRKLFHNCRRIEDYETQSQFHSLYDFMNEDNFYIRYFCRSLEGELMKWQKQYYGLREHQHYKRCMDCHCLFEFHTYNQKRCPGCQTSFNRKNKTEKQRSYRVEKLKA